ncbi:holo-ACP synthase [Clostridium sp. AM58-1XD]|uniref:holo-ACP synthase n=1 Tax=Clostridium sp. AM58-1XD TaxID=2292307 RepID=UPI000E49B256|nr:holo-ACP synthase [Clostridium sp. AM58-1XD]RGZ00666.1 holo-[acyl-carrier-protein] synthase [Clostridium sp. AM58-1XD]
MIAGVGTDMVEISRIRKACERQSFLERVYTEEERRQAGDNYSRLAGSFAVKEAVSKVFGTGFRSFSPCDIEVLRDEKGKPYVRLYGGADECFRSMGMIRIEVSITNTKEYAMAFAVGERAETKI